MAGICIIVKQAEVLSARDKDSLWSLGYLSTNTPEQLLNILIFSIGKGFVQHVGKEHRVERSIPFSSQFRFMKHNNGEIIFRCTEDIGLKTNKGGIRHRKLQPKVVDHYAKNNPERYLLLVIIQYLSLLLPFTYSHVRSTLESPGTPTRLLGSNAGLSAFYINHSLCSTAVMNMYQEDMNEQLIQEITGHRLLVVHSYKRTSDS